MTGRAKGVVRAVKDVQARTRARGEAVMQRRHEIPVLDAAVEVVERDTAIGGGILAGALAYRIFFFLLPLAVASVGVLAAVSSVTGRTPESVAHDAGLRGLVTSSVSSAASSSNAWWYAILISAPLLVYVTSGLLRVLAGIHRLAWGLPARGPRPSLRVTVAFLCVMLAFFVVAGAAAAVRAHSSLGGLAATLVSGALFGAGWLGLSVAFHHGDAPIRSLAPGAILFAAGAEALHLFFVYVLARLAASKENAYGELGLAAALLFSLYLAGRLIVATAVLNGTLWDRRARQAVSAAPAVDPPSSQRLDVK